MLAVLAASLLLGQSAPHAVWDLDKAWREKTTTRERVCLNGLWRWQPAEAVSDQVPADHWGWFKVPGPWPGITDYMQTDCQTVSPDPSWKTKNLGSITAAWYQREFTVPGSWKGRIQVETAYVNSLANCYVDGRSAGRISFPEGAVDISGLVKPGEKHVLSMEVLALPLKSVFESYSDTSSAKLVRATVPRRGLCGDVYLTCSPERERIEDVRAEPSFQNGTLGVRARFANLAKGEKYRLNVQILDQGKPVKSFSGPEFFGGDTTYFKESWKPQKLWDTDTPSNQFEMSVSLQSASGKQLDVALKRKFGYRELWIKGRDFILNGTRILIQSSR